MRHALSTVRQMQHLQDDSYLTSACEFALQTCETFCSCTRTCGPPPACALLLFAYACSYGFFRIFAIFLASGENTCQKPPQDAAVICPAGARQSMHGSGLAQHAGGAIAWLLCRHRHPC
jgi:hypothetical protein